MRTLHTNFRWYADGSPQEMLVEDDRVVERGARVDVTGDVGRVDHAGETLLPAFVDAHAHILPTGLDLKKLHLGRAESHEDVLDLLRARHGQQPDGWLLAVHYDHNRYASGHLSAEQLDALAGERPILLRHVSGHAGVCNSAALRAAGVNESTPDPGGGTFVRDASGRLTGVLLEEALAKVSAAMPKPTLEEMVEAILVAGASMRAYGIVCAADMMTGNFDLGMELEAYQLAADRGCQIATRLYVQWSKVFGTRVEEPGRLESTLKSLGREDARSNSCRVSGIKIFADGAIGSGTAAIYGRYIGTEPQETSGTLIYEPARLTNMVLRASLAGFQVCVHSIGDYATDLVMRAFHVTGAASRHRIEHAMLLSDAQIRRLAESGCYVCLQPEFLAHFGDTYKRQLGPERASKLKRTRSMIDAGIPLSFGSDRPIVAGNPWTGIGAAVSRPSGFDPGENCTWAEAVAAYTVKASEVCGDGDQFGTLLPGSWALWTSQPKND